jgi:hypothetical protein
MGCGALRAARCMISVYSGAIETGLPMSVECAFSFFSRTLSVCISNGGRYGNGCNEMRTILPNKTEGANI